MIKLNYNIQFKIVLIIILICSNACNKLNTNKSTTNTNTPYTMPAEAYLALAKNQNNNDNRNMLLMAAGSYIESGNLQQAAKILQQIINPSINQFSEKNILSAKIKNHHHQYKEAISQLATIQNLHDLPIYYQQQYHEVLAISYMNTNNFIDAINERIVLAALISDPNSNINNNRNLWLLLLRLSNAELQTLYLETINQPILQGWLKLSLIARETRQQIFFDQLQTWQQQYPQHQANSILTNITELSASINNSNSSQQIAVLLPITGIFSGPGTAIRDGIFAANRAENIPNINIQVYDTNNIAAAELYNQAIINGADLIIGPLLKDDVAAVAQLEHPVPTLLLNDSNIHNDSNLYSFNLSPMIESQQLAAQAHKNGYYQTLIIAPNNSWSINIINTFNKTWSKNNGIVVDTLLYDDNTNFNIAIRDFLKVSANQANAPQYHTQITSPRRQDFDMIFLLAYPSKAAQIMPMLRYYFANDIPIYALSLTYAGNINTLRDQDLDGIMFLDMPWIFDHQLENKNWPEQFNSYTRLYAMGISSYAIVIQLAKLIVFPAIVDNVTQMILYLNQLHQIIIIPALGKFNHGHAQFISFTA